jgi:hypothetical protein
MTYASYYDTGGLWQHLSWPWLVATAAAFGLTCLFAHHGIRLNDRGLGYCSLAAAGVTLVCFVVTVAGCLEGLLI